MREALRGLTIRGRSFLVAGLAATVCALVLGEKDLLRVAVLLLILPVLAIAYVGRNRHTLTCSRSLDPRRVTVDGSARIVLRLENRSRLPTGTLLLEDQLPPELGRRPRVVLERLGVRQASSVSYTVYADQRGRYDIGPLVVRLTDPFGLCELTRVFPDVDRLTVLPRVVPLPSVRLPGAHGGTGESHARSVAAPGDDDTSTREYRRGDDLRRVHWKSTARTGALMVRREEQPWESAALLALDTRLSAHVGDGPTSSFEWAVSAAASIAAHLTRAGYKLRLVTGPGNDSGPAEWHAPPAVAGQLALDRLADVRLAPGELGELVDRVRRHNDTGLVIAVLGALTPAEAELLAGLRITGVTCVGLLIDTASWREGPSTTAVAEDPAHQAAALALAHSGWRVVGISRDADLAALWPHVTQGTQGFAWRAALADTIAGGQ